MEWHLVIEGSGIFWKKSALLLVFVQPYKEESAPGIGGRSYGFCSSLVGGSFLWT